MCVTEPDEKLLDPCGTGLLDRGLEVHDLVADAQLKVDRGHVWEGGEGNLAHLVVHVTQVDILRELGRPARGADLAVDGERVDPHLYGELETRGERGLDTFIELGNPLLQIADGLEVEAINLSKCYYYYFLFSVVSFGRIGKCAYLLLERVENLGKGFGLERACLEGLDALGDALVDQDEVVDLFMVVGHDVGEVANKLGLGAFV